MKKELKRIKTNFTVDQLNIINNLQGPEWENVAFSLKVEKLIDIALAYQPYWEEHKVFEAIKGAE